MNLQNCDILKKYSEGCRKMVSHTNKPSKTVSKILHIMVDLTKEKGKKQRVDFEMYVSFIDNMDQENSQGNVALGV